MSRKSEERRDAREARKAERRVVRAEKKRARAESFLSLVAADEPASPEDRGLAACLCPKECPLHGDCRLCVAYHAGRRREEPHCAR